MSYDHSKKAGNPGDVVKHVALHAAVRVLAKQKKGNRAFRFADVYAGYAFSVLEPGGEWRQGVGRLSSLRRQRKFGARNPDLRRWVEWYAPPRPTLERSQYPSSGLVARDAVLDLGRKFKVGAWDVQLACCESLEAFWGAECVRHAAANPGDSMVKSADLVFVDPPSREHWPNVRLFLQSCSKRKQPVLAWLPMTVGVAGRKGAKKKAVVSKPSRDLLKEAKGLGFKVASSQWAKGGRTIGCALVHDLCSQSAVRALNNAVAATNRTLGWQRVK